MWHVELNYHLYTKEELGSLENAIGFAKMWGAKVYLNGKQI